MSPSYLTRRVRFSAAHRYARPDWSEDKNRAVFGPCSNPHGHGHNYRLDVTVQAPIDDVTGFTIDIARLDAILREDVVAPLDHQHLNHAIPEFRDGGQIPTCENIARWLWLRLEPRFTASARLHRLRLYEDDDLFVDYFGDST
ncbi:MAG TPA: 6-carboxytetrahydropterin synthase [Longimicrobiales bacterium]|nr:6-carboxytetrahydropterin synthase [Longimicrobiales bacterium]